MDLSFEMPTKYLNELGTYNDYDFCLAHLVLANPTYLEYYKDTNKYKICDNSAFELEQPLPNEEVIKAANMLGAQEVVCPDAFHNNKGTCERTQGFINYVKSIGDINKFKLMGVVQGENIPSWYSCLSFMNNNKDIDVIGINYASCGIFDDDPKMARIKAVRAALDQAKVRKIIHLLGVGGNPIEVKEHGHIPNLRSCDTSIPIVQGLSGDRFDEEIGINGSKLPRPNNFFEMDLSNKQIEDIKYNLGMMKTWTASLVNG